MDEQALLHKLRLIEALFAGAATPGEQQAAAEAAKRITARLEELHENDPPIEYQFRMTDRWSRQLFCALARRYGLNPYRYSRQRRTTVMLRVPKTFVDETLWPEFQKFSDTLEAYFSEVTDRMVHQAIHADASDASIQPEPLQIG